MNRRVVLRALAGIAVSIIAVVLVAQTADVPAALAQVATVDPRALLLPTVVILVQLLVRAVRWSGILSAMAGEPTSFAPPPTITIATAPTATNRRTRWRLLQPVEAPWTADFRGRGTRIIATKIDGDQRNAEANAPSWT